MFNIQKIYYIAKPESTNVICSPVASDFNSRLILTRYYSNTMDIALPSDSNSIVVTVSIAGLIFLGIHRINVFKC